MSLVKNKVNNTDGVIIRAELFLVPGFLPPHWQTHLRLAEDMGEVFEANLVLKLNTDSGKIGTAGNTLYTEQDIDRSVAEAVCLLLPHVLNKCPSEKEKIWEELSLRYCNCAPQAQSLIDIALWDLVSKIKGVPLSKYLGGEKDRIAVYASLPTLDTIEDYLNSIREHIELGFPSIKLHTWCNLEKDLALLDLLAKSFAKSDIQWIIDLEERYRFKDTLHLLDAFEQMNYGWLEAPFRDADFKLYRQLRKQSPVPIIPAGNTIFDTALIEIALEMGAWDAIRVDVTKCGGFTSLNTINELAKLYNVPIELQSWGFSLTQAANLHAMLGFGRTSMFELSVPEEKYKQGTTTGLQISDGAIKLNQLPGLGIEMDWDYVRKNAIFYRFFETA